MLQIQLPGIFRQDKTQHVCTKALHENVQRTFGHRHRMMSMRGCMMATKASILGGEADRNFEAGGPGVTSGLGSICAVQCPLRSSVCHLSFPLLSSDG